MTVLPPPQSVEVGGGEGQQEREERQRLMELVQLQANEAAAIREEIHLLSHKGGHILPPSQPPLGSPAHSHLPPAPL